MEFLALLAKINLNKRNKMSLLRKLTLATAILTGLAAGTDSNQTQAQQIFRLSDGKLIARDSAEVSQPGYLAEQNQRQVSFSDIYNARKAQWEQNIRTGNTELPNVLSTRSDVSDLAKAMGESRWRMLTEAQKQQTVKTWNNSKQNVKTNICEIYLNPVEYFTKDMNDKQRNGFEMFKKAYEALAENTEHAGLHMFKTRDGSMTKDYKREYPWINLNQPTVPDLVLIFMNEFEYNKGVRINMNSIMNYGR